MQAIDIEAIRACDLTDSAGALRILERRFGKSYSHDSLRNLVKFGKLRAFMFADGEFVLRVPDERTRGKDLLFLRADLEALEPPNKPGRPPTK